MRVQKLTQTLEGSRRATAHSKGVPFLGPMDLTKMAIPILGTARSESELLVLVGRTADAHPGKSLLFRGQTDLHPRIQSGEARGLHVVGEVEIAWSRLAARMLGIKSCDAPGARFSKALLQHYGLPTQFVDLTSDPSIAAWFALHQFRFTHIVWGGADLRSFKRVKYARLDQDFGHVLVIALPEPSNLEVAGQLFCLSNLPLEVLRLHRQLGWLFYDGADGSCDINEFCLGSIEIDRQTFNLPSLSQERLFPPPTVDVAYRDLLGFPWVQTPTIYFRPQPPEESSADRGNEEFRKASERWCHADRAISTPEYFENQDGYDHKWDDITLYEPHPVRVWKGWHFELSSRFPQWSGDIANSVKITLSERARAVLEGASESVPCAWPDLESSDLFFSFSQMGHDKVIEREPPYRGVWLHRCGDWIVETVTNADEEVLNLGPGLAYVLQDSELTPQSVPDTCACGNTESHLRRVQSILRLPHFVFTGEITFVPHPAFIPAWYVAV